MSKPAFLPVMSPEQWKEYIEAGWFLSNDKEACPNCQAIGRMNIKKKDVCAICKALFIDGIGFVEKHYSMCRNNVYGENWIIDVDNDFKRPAGEIDSGGVWNTRIDTEPDIIEWRTKHFVGD